MNDAVDGTRILGTLRIDGDHGVVRIEDRLRTGIDDAWSAVTDPARLARWYGEVEGDLRAGGEYRAHASQVAGKARAGSPNAIRRTGSSSSGRIRTSPTRRPRRSR